MSKIEDRTLLGLAAAAYRPAAGSEQSGAPYYAHIPPEHWNARDVPVTDDMLRDAKKNLEARGVHVPAMSSSFSGHLYLVKQPDDKETPVIAYRGTDNLADMVTNVNIGSGTANVQFANALLFYEAARLTIKDDPKINQQDLVFTGHSLGGGLAALMGSYTGHEAVTVNAAPHGIVAENMRRGLYVTQENLPPIRPHPLVIAAQLAGKAAHFANTGTVSAVHAYPADGSKPADFAQWYIPPSDAPQGAVRNVVYRGEILDYLKQDFGLPFPQPYFTGDVNITTIAMDGQAGRVDLHSAYSTNLLAGNKELIAPLAARMPELVTEMFRPDVNRVGALNQTVKDKGYRSDHFYQQLLRDNFPNGEMSKGFLADLNTIAAASDTLQPEVRRALVQVAIQHAAHTGDAGTGNGQGIIQMNNGAISIDLARFPETEKVAAVATLGPVILPEAEGAANLPIPQYIIIGGTGTGTTLSGTPGNDWIISRAPGDRIVALGGNDVVTADRSDRIFVTLDESLSRQPAAFIGNGNIAAAGMRLQSEDGSTLVLSDQLPNGSRAAPMVIANTGKRLEEVLPLAYREMTKGSDDMGDRSEVSRIAVERTGYAKTDPRNNMQLLAQEEGRQRAHLLVLEDGRVQAGGVDFGNNPQIAAGKNGGTLGVLYAGDGVMTAAQYKTVGSLTEWLDAQRKNEGLTGPVEVIAGSTNTAELLDIPTPRGPLPAAGMAPPTRAPVQSRPGMGNGM